MNINMPQVGDVWTNRTGQRVFVINDIAPDAEWAKWGKDHYNILCTEVNTGKIREGKLWFNKDIFRMHIQGAGTTDNTLGYAGSRFGAPVATYFAGDLVPPGWTIRDVYTVSKRNKTLKAIAQAHADNARFESWIQGLKGKSVTQAAPYTC